MTPLPWTGFRRGILLALQGRLPGPHDQAQPPWARAARQRRGALLALIALVATAAAALHLLALPDPATLWHH
jgi:hypothetical protein